MHRGSIVALSLAGSLMLSAPLAAEPEIEWRESYFNPQPAEGDVILPMPCGGAMAFRRVETRSPDGAIGDVDVILGQEGGEAPYLNGLRRAYVSGGFRTGNARDGVPYFLMAKYELAQAQYDVVMDGCPERSPRKRAFVPAVEHSRLDFARFAEAWTLWLLQEAPEYLPQTEGVHGYVRLPTEDEWEFAARGGLSVEPANFRAPRPPIAPGQDPAEFIAHGGTDSAGGKVQVIGTLAANPLGLHDMLGNAAEIVETPFAAVRHGRLHGQVGGYVKRGGDARTPLSQITSATRFEISPIDAISVATTRDRFTGTRVVVAGLSITSVEQAEAMRRDLERLAEIDATSVSAATEDEVSAMIAAMLEEAETERDRSRIALIRDTVERARAERNAERDAALRLLLTSGTLICDQAVQRYLNALAIRNMAASLDALETEARADGNADLVEEIRGERAFAAERLAQLEARAMAEITEYANLVEGLSEDTSADTLSRQSGFIAATVDAKGPRRAACLDGLERHLAVRRAAGFVDLEMVALDMQGIAVEQAQE